MERKKIAGDRTIMQYLACSVLTERAKKPLPKKHHGSPQSADNEKDRPHQPDFFADFSISGQCDAFRNHFGNGNGAARSKNRQQKLINFIGRAQIAHAIRS